jgi:predicted membrane chloride channel (bestrophin family)
LAAGFTDSVEKIGGCNKMGDPFGVVVHSNKPGKKYLGHRNTIISKRREEGNWFSNAYIRFIYDQRPDVTHQLTRKKQWEQLHSQKRFIQALFCYLGPPCHLLWNLRLPLSLIFIVTMTSVIYYALQDTLYPGLPNFDGPGVIRTTFTSGSFAVSLLLAMRLNRSYERFLLASTSFGDVAVYGMEAAQYMAMYCDDKALVFKFMGWLSTYHYALMKMVLSLPEIHPDVANYLTPEELAVVKATKEEGALAALQAKKILLKANLRPDRNTLIAGHLSNVERKGAICASVKLQAIPYSISMVATGFVFIWLLFLPLGFGKTVQIAKTVQITTGPVVTDIVLEYVVVMVAFLFFAFLLLALDEISNQLEDPFYQLPLYEMVKSFEIEMADVFKNSKLLDEASAKEAARLEGETGVT